VLLGGIGVGCFDFDFCFDLCWDFDLELVRSVCCEEEKREEGEV